MLKLYFLQLKMLKFVFFIVSLFLQIYGFTNLKIQFKLNTSFLKLLNLNIGKRQNISCLINEIQLINEIKIAIKDYKKENHLY